MRSTGISHGETMGVTCGSPQGPLGRYLAARRQQTLGGKIETMLALTAITWFFRGCAEQTEATR